MSDFTDARASLETSITANKTFLEDQADEPTITNTFTDLDAIGAALKEWARARISIEAIDKSCSELEDMLEGTEHDVLTGLDASFASYVAELRLLIDKIAKEAKKPNT